MVISFEGLINWLVLLTIHDILILLFFPIVIEYSRSIFKISFLILYNVRNQKKKLKEYCPPAIFRPKITILIPALNKEYGIAKTIESVINNGYPNKEIIVIDDNSTDSTYKIAWQFYEQGLIKLIHRSEANSSKAQALNQGLSHATGSLILCMDADTQLDKNAIEHATKYLEVDENILAISGNLRVNSGDNGIQNIVTKLQSYEFFTGVDFGRRFASALNILMIISGAIGVFRKSTLESVEKYDDDTLGEDFDLTLKICKLGKKIQFSENTSIGLDVPNNLPDLIRQRIKWSCAQMQVLIKHRDGIWDSKYRLRFRIAILDMWLMEVIINFMGIASLIVLISFTIISFFSEIKLVSLDELIYLWTLLFSIYFISELTQFSYAVHISSRKKLFRLIYLIPLMIFMYRPMLRIVTVVGHLSAIRYKK